MPHTQGATLYIRPTIIATDAMLGVHAAHTYKFYIILSPSGAYYAGGLAPVDIYVEDKYVRAVAAASGFPRPAATTPPPSAPGSGRSRTATPRCSGWTAFTGSILRKWAP